jgi:ribosome biogenesis protein BRX1
VAVAFTASVRLPQVLAAADKKKVTEDSLSLVEVGPRCCLNPIRIFSGSFGGPVLYENPSYVSPNVVRAALKRKKAGKYTTKVAARERRRGHRQQNKLPKGALADVFK